MIRQRHAEAQPRKACCHSVGANPHKQLMVGILRRRARRRTSRAPSSSATAALSIADAPTPMTTTRFPCRVAKSKSSEECDQRLRGRSRTKDGIVGAPSPSRPLARTTRRVRMEGCSPPTISSSRRLSSGRTRHLDTVLHRELQHVAVPAQVFHP